MCLNQHKDSHTTSLTAEVTVNDKKGNSTWFQGLLVNQGPTGHVTKTARTNMNITS